MSRRDLIRHLVRHGCVLVREGANHSIWENPANGNRSAVPRHREIPDPTARAICRQLGVPEPESPTGRPPRRLRHNTFTSSPVAVNGRLYLRGWDTLWCVGAK